MTLDFSEWEGTYKAICRDLGYDPAADELSVRVLAALTLNSDLRDEEDIRPLIGHTVSVIGGSAGMENEVADHPPEGCIICSGSAVARFSAVGGRPDIIVTDLDGDIDAQLKASSEGVLTLILAHGDNADLVRRYASLFKGPIVLTTQGRPSGNVFDFGGFTDGDRCVCLAREFGAGRIFLYGFDFEHPFPKEGSDPAIKRRKLSWAKRIIFDGRHHDITGRSERSPIPSAGTWPIRGKANYT